jgi:hypothetical protein
MVQQEAQPMVIDLGERAGIEFAALAPAATVVGHMRT